MLLLAHHECSGACPQRLNLCVSYYVSLKLLQAPVLCIAAVPPHGVLAVGCSDGGRSDPQLITCDARPILDRESQWERQVLDTAVMLPKSVRSPPKGCRCAEALCRQGLRFFSMSETAEREAQQLSSSMRQALQKVSQGSSKDGEMTLRSLDAQKSDHLKVGA
eukprot:5122125-Amphidinium_carterae.1